MTSPSLAHIPRGSIPYTQHWNCSSSSFSNITDDACPGFTDNFTRHFGALTGLVDSLFVAGTIRPTTGYTDPIINLSLSVDRALTANEMTSGLLTILPTAPYTITTLQPSAADLVAELQTLYPAGINDGFAYYFTLINSNIAFALTYEYTNQAGGNTLDIVPDKGTVYQIVVTDVSTPAFFVRRIIGPP
jgi:hypothetical protein